MKKHLLLSATLTTLALAGCHKQAPPGENRPGLPSATVQTALVSAGTNQAIEQVVGTVRARNTALVSAKVSGRVKTLVNQIGRAVKAGELLAEIDAAEIAARVEQARAGLDNATRELNRFQKLLDQKAVTLSEFEAVESRHRIAKAMVSESETMLSYTRVESPFDGVISRKLTDVGDLASPGRPLVEVEALGSLRFETDLAEALASRIHLGETLAVQIDGVAAPLRATVAEIAPAANPLSRTLMVKLDLPQNEDLRAGQFGRLSVPVKGNTNLRVPAAALVRRGQLEILFVAEQGKARLRLVRTGKRLADQIEILAGLEAGETIVTDGHAKLRDGQPLTLAEVR